MTLLILPLRNQGFDDDFAYIQTAINLNKTGVLRISDWASATMVFQPYWGSLFYTIFGHNITSFHISNIVLFYFGLIFFYLLLKRLKLNEFRSTIFSLVLLSSPWVFNFVFTFMSDTFYVSLAIISLYWYTRGLQDNNKFSLFLGSLFSGFAFLTRQIGITIPIAIFIVYLYQAAINKVFDFKKILWSLLPVAIIVMLYFSWLNHVGLTAYQYVTIGPKFKKDFLSIIFPFSPGHIGGVNSFYIEFSVQRLSAYINVLISCIFPVVLIYKTNIKNIFKFIKENLLGLTITGAGLALIYHINTVYKNKFTSRPPSSIIYSYNYLFDWNKVWPLVFWLAIPFVALLLWFLVRKLFSFVFIKRKRTYNKLFRVLLTILFAGTLYFLSIVIKQSFPVSFRIGSNSEIYPFFADLNGYISILKDRNLTKELLHGSWFFLITFLSSVIVFVYALTHLKINKLHTSKLPILLICLVSVGHFILVLIAAYFFWEEYIIQMTPFIILGIAYLTQKIELNKFFTYLVIIYMLFFSVQTTRNRYQTIGVKWELATKLVNEYHVNPLNVSESGWGWRPWWFFESTFAEKVKQAGGNKYKVANIGDGWNDLKVSGDTFDVVEISKEDSKYIMVSDPFWTFWQWRRYAIVKN
jgi:hypothetical protein